MKRLLIFLLAFFPLVASGQKTFDLDLPHNRSTTYTADTFFLAHDSTYITSDTDSMKFVVDDGEVLRLVDVAGVGQARFDDGAAATPSISFIDDYDQGLYRPSAGQTAVSINGIGVFIFEAGLFKANVAKGAALSTGAGTSTFPAFTNRSDQNTGIGWAGSDSLSLIAGGVEGIRIAEGSGSIVTTMTDDVDIGGTLDVDSAVSIGAWGYTGEHIVFSEASSNTNPLLGVFGEANFDVSAGKTIAGTYSRALVSANQTNQSSIVGIESQFRLRDVDVGDGMHAGIWAYAEQSGTTTLSGSGTFDAIDATVESGSGFTVGATERVSGITVDASIDASATIDASANYSGIFIKSNGKDWFDGLYITGATNDIKLKNGATINNGGANTLTITEPTIALVGNETLTGTLSVDSAVSIGAWGYTGEHIVFSEASSNTNPLLGVFGEANFDVSAGKTIAGTYSRALASANQTNQSTIVGTESQFRLRNVDIADGVHAGLWAYAEQSGTSTLSGNGTFDAISACVESEAGFTVGATEHVTGITIDGSINASATIDASANFSGLYIKSNGKDWFDGIKITGATNDIKLKNGATINNIRTANLTITEDTVDIVGVLTASSIASDGAVSGTDITGSGTVQGADLIATNMATPTTTVLTPTSTGQIDTLETTDLATADFTVTGDWTFNLITIDSADINYGDIDTLVADYSTMNIMIVDSADINYADIDTLVADYSTMNIVIADSIDANYIDTDTLLVNEFIEFDNGATIENIRSGNLTITEDTVAVVGVLDVTGNTEVSGALTATGNITGATMVCLHTAATYVFSDLDSCKNVAHFNSDADVIDFTLPGAEAGLVMMFYDIGGGVITIDPVDGTDTIYLNGTSVGAGDAIDSPGAVGDFICLMAIDATRWVTVGRSGTWIDGGAD